MKKSCFLLFGLVILLEGCATTNSFQAGKRMSFVVVDNSDTFQVPREQVQVTMVNKSQGQDKMNPDGYIDGLSINLLPGYTSIASDDYSVSGPSLNFGFLLPSSETSSYYLIFNWEKLNHKIRWDHTSSSFSYSNLYIGLGFKFYIKNVFNK